MEINNKNTLGQLVETNNGNMINKQNKQNNIKKNNEIKVIKTDKNKKNDKKSRSKKSFEEKFKPEYILTAHEGIASLQLAQTTPRTPREAMAILYKQGLKELNNVSMYVKGYLPDSDNSMVVVTNVNTTKLLSNHCNIVVKNNPDIVNYFGKLIKCNIELYPYSDNVGKYSFNIIEVLEVEDKECYENINTKLDLPTVPFLNTDDVNTRIDNLLRSSETYKMKVLNELVSSLEYISEILYGNTGLIINYVLDTLFMSTNVDRLSLSDTNFVNKYFYDITMNLVNSLLIVYNTNDKTFTNISKLLFISIATYLNSPSVNNGVLTNEFKLVCKYFNISVKHARYFQMINPDLYSIEYSTIEFRTKFIDILRRNVLSFCETIQ